MDGFFRSFKMVAVDVIKYSILFMNLREVTKKLG